MQYPDLCFHGFNFCTVQPHGGEAVWKRLESVKSSWGSAPLSLNIDGSVAVES